MAINIENFRIINRNATAKKSKEKSDQNSLKERRSKIIKLFRFLITDILREKLQQRVLGRNWVKSRRSQRNKIRAERFRSTALELGGVLIKLGQYLSTRFDLLPEEWLVELAKLQDAVPPVDFEELRPSIELDFGDKLENLFLEFDTVPLASASLGQVHRAVLLDGTEVAVKILRPNIHSIIEADLEALNRVIDFLSKRTDLGKLADLKGIAREFEVTLRRELDYMQEGKSAERIKENLKKLKYIYIPKVYWERTSSRVLTTEFIHGYKVTNYEAIDAAGIDRYRAARILANCYLNQILIDGFFHADPHPGNLFVRLDENGNVQVAFVDFGMVGEVTPEMKKQLRRMVVAVVQRDTDTVLDAMRKLNFIRKEEDIDKIRVAINYLLDKFLGLSVGELRQIDYRKTFDEMSFIIYSQPLYLPGDFSFLSRALDTLVGVASGLSPKLNFLNETKPFLRYLIDEQTKPNSSNSNGNQPSLLNPIVADQLRDAALNLITLPRTLSNTLERIDKERVQSQLQSQEVKRAADKVEKLGSRIVAGILAASALISGSLIANIFMQYWRGQSRGKG